MSVDFYLIILNRLQYIVYETKRKVSNMPKDKGPKWNHVCLIDDTAKNVALARIQCVYCAKMYTGGVNRIRVHLTGEGNSIAKCASAPDAVVAEMMECNKERVRLELLKKKRD